MTEEQLTNLANLIQKLVRMHQLGEQHLRDLPDIVLTAGQKGSLQTKIDSIRSEAGTIADELGVRKIR